MTEDLLQGTLVIYAHTPSLVLFCLLSVSKNLQENMTEPQNLPFVEDREESEL